MGSEATLSRPPKPVPERPHRGMLPRRDITGVNAQDPFSPADPTPTQPNGIMASTPVEATRISNPRIQVAIESSIAAPRADPTHPPVPAVIHFNDQGNFDSLERRVFQNVPRLAASTKTFEWKPANDSVDVTRIRWIARNSTTPFFIRDCLDCPTIQDIDLKADGFPSDSAITNVTTTGAQLLLSSEKIKPYYRFVMSIVLTWETSSGIGFSRSGIFTVVDNPMDASNERIILDNQIRLNTNDDTGAELWWNRTASTSSSVPSSTSGATTGGEAASDAAGSLQGSSKAGGSGLSTGAKAGIGAAVGAAGLLLLLGLLFFFLRRRKPNSKSIPPGDPSTASTFLIADAQKMAAIDPVASSPSSSPHLVSHPQRSSSLPLDANTTGTGRGGISGGDLGDSTPSLAPAVEMPLPTGVSRHLVEEGMTREQILLLEEEERQLDAAIHERAARRL